MTPKAAEGQGQEVPAGGHVGVRVGRDRLAVAGRVDQQVVEAGQLAGTDVEVDGDVRDALVDQLGVREKQAGVALRASRRQVGLAILNADESLERLLSERRGRANDLTPAMTLVTYARRFTEFTCADIMSRAIVSVTPETSAQAALALIDRHQVKALPVIVR